MVLQPQGCGRVGRREGFFLFKSGEKKRQARLEKQDRTKARHKARDKKNKKQYNLETGRSEQFMRE
jgi:hypothetical protein